MQIKLPETKEAFEILKARWPEVVFIIALSVLSLSINMTYTIFHLAGNLLSILIILVSYIFAIIILMLITGFQRTIYLEDGKRQSLLVLFREGEHFILRLVSLGLIYILSMTCLQFLVLWVVKYVAPSFMETRLGLSLIYLLPSFSVNLVLIKLMLLIFPIIIVLDCGIFESFKMLGRCRLKDARELVILFLISLGLPFLWKLLPSQYGMTILHYFLLVLRVIAGQFIDLMIAVMAIRFVAAQNLIYDNSVKPLDSQGLLNSSI